jgi:hypothetical protein
VSAAACRPRARHAVRAPRQACWYALHHLSTHAAPRLRLRPGQCRAPHAGAAGMARAQEHPAHGALHRAGAGSVPRRNGRACGRQYLQAGAPRIGRQILILNASTEHDIDSAVRTLIERRAAGLLVAADPFFTIRREQLVALAAYHAIPAIYEWREFALAGGGL